VYLREYFEFLPENRFPTIENHDLLESSSHRSTLIPQSRDDLVLSPNDVPGFVYGLDIETLRKVSKEGGVETDPKIFLLDISSPETYAKYHLPGAISGDFERIVENLDAFRKSLNGKMAVIVCER